MCFVDFVFLSFPSRICLCGIHELFDPKPTICLTVFFSFGCRPKMRTKKEMAYRRRSIDSFPRADLVFAPRETPGFLRFICTYLENLLGAVFSRTRRRHQEAVISKADVSKPLRRGNKERGFREWYLGHIHPHFTTKKQLWRKEFKKKLEIRFPVAPVSALPKRQKPQEHCTHHINDDSADARGTKLSSIPATSSSLSQLFLLLLPLLLPLLLLPFFFFFLWTSTTIDQSNEPKHEQRR